MSSSSACDQEPVMSPIQFLPLDVINEILLRLPVSSLLRFKSVCKSWHSLISDSKFALSHYHLSAAPTVRVLIRADCFHIKPVDVDSNFTYGNQMYRRMPYPAPPAFQYEYDYYADDFRKATHEVIGSCRGLVLFQYRENSHLILWNPATDACERIHVFRGISYPQHFGFGYDPVTDDYLMVCIVLHKGPCLFWVLSFKKPTWERIMVHDSYTIFGVHLFRAGSLVGNSLNWLVFSKDKHVPVILAFDLVQRSYSEIPLMNEYGCGRYELYGLRVMEECLVLCCLYRHGETSEIWMMKQYKVQSSWTKWVVWDNRGIRSNCLSPLCKLKDGGILGSNILGTLSKVNDKGQTYEHLGFREIPRFFVPNQEPRRFEDNLQVSMYTESLMTPNVIGGDKDKFGAHIVHITKLDT